jgi:hypothetical protein
MALYLGSCEKIKLVLDNVTYNVNLFSTSLILNGIKLLSSEGYILRDSNGLYLTSKESE